MKQFFTTLLCVIIIAGLAGGGFFAYKYFTKPAPEETEIKVTINDTVLTEKTTEMTFGFGSENNVKIEGAEEYNVKIISNDEKAFEYMVNGESKKFEKLDLTSKFNIEYQSNGFKLKFSENFIIEDLVKELHEEGAEIELPKIEDAHVFKLVIEFENDVEFNVVFSIEKIVLSTSEIII